MGMGGINANSIVHNICYNGVEQASLPEHAEGLPMLPPVGMEMKVPLVKSFARRKRERTALEDELFFSLL